MYLFSSNVAFEELVLRSLEASPLIKPSLSLECGRRRNVYIGRFLSVSVRQSADSRPTRWPLFKLNEMRRWCVGDSFGPYVTFPMLNIPFPN